MLIRLIKQNVPMDSFLEWLHCLVLMDDTVIIATSRQSLLQKLTYLEKYCNEYGMIMNQKKTKLLVVNGDEQDRLPIQLGEVTIHNAQSYVYLGAVVTEDGSTASSIQKHAKDKEYNLNKLLIFLASNYDAPFYVKRKVFYAAFSSAILYSMESWVGYSTKPIESLYMKGVKALLGVRSSTPDNLCLLEAGLPPLHSLVHQAQGRFFRKMMHRMDLEDDPIGHILRLIEREDPWMWERIKEVRLVDDHVKVGMKSLHDAVSSDVCRRSTTYKLLNPDLSVHKLYVQSSLYIQDSLRIGFTRVRLSSHRLRVETGRWSRIPRCDRLCSCGQFQDEEHILICRKNITVLKDYSYTEGHLGLTHLFGKLDVKHLTLLTKLLDVTERH